MQDWSHSPKHDRGPLTVRVSRILVRAMTFGAQPACGFRNTGQSKVSLGLFAGVSIDSSPDPGLAKIGAAPTMRARDLLGTAPRGAIASSWRRDRLN